MATISEMPLFSVYEILITLAILLLNFAIVIWFKNKTSLISSVILMNLLIILLCALSVNNYQILKEIIIAVVIYSITILALISNANKTPEAENDLPRKNQLFSKKFSRVLIFICVFAISAEVFYLSLNIKPKLLSNDSGLQIERIAEIRSNEIVIKDSARNNLKNNVLVKRSTDAVLIIVGIMTIMFLASKYRCRETNI
ncbi:MAG: hypothetical protein ACI9TO_000122 [Rickettsiales bacterium]|jgi:hypothetical protein